MSVNAPTDRSPVNAKCHCGAVALTITLSDGVNTARRCDCSFCRMRGAVAVSAPLDGVQIVKGAENLTLYEFNTRVAQHYFCRVCGIYTHHKRRSNPNEYGVNVAILEGWSPFDFTEIIVNDGINHPTDRTDNTVAGILRFTPTP